MRRRRSNGIDDIIEELGIIEGRVIFGKVMMEVCGTKIPVGT